MMERRVITTVLLLGLVIFFMYTPQVISQEYNPCDYWAVIAACCMYPSAASHDAQLLYHVLSEHYGFDGIYYLDVRTNLPGVNASATRNNFRWAIRNYLMNSDGNDLIFIFIVGHGGGYNTIEQRLQGGRIDGSQGDPQDEGLEHFINGQWVGIDESIYFDGSEVYWDDELTDDLSILSYYKLIFVRVGGIDGTEGGCFNGGLIDDISAPNRIIMTASNETYYCWADLDNDGFSEWSEAFIDALHGEDTYYNATSNQIVHTGVRINADLDDNGYVSLFEAWQYAWDHDDARLQRLETPWFDDDGDGLPTFISGSDHLDTDGQGDLARQTILEPRLVSILN